MRDIHRFREARTLPSYPFSRSLSPHHLGASCTMEVLYDSEVDIKPSSGIQCIPYGHVEPFRMAQAAPGTPTHFSPLHDTSVKYHKPAELTTVTTAESGHPLASAFVMQSSSVEDGEGSSSSNVTLTSNFRLKRNASTVGLARHPMVSIRCS